MNNSYHIGEKYNHLTIISKGPDFINSKGNHIKQVWCKCDCGNKDLQLFKVNYIVVGDVKGCKECKSKRMSESQIGIRRKFNSYKFIDDYVYIYP